MESKLKLSNKFSNYLAELPEQGMGFQIVDVELKNGNLLNNRIIFNSTFLKLKENENIKNKDIKSIVLKYK